MASFHYVPGPVAQNFERNIFSPNFRGYFGTLDFLILLMSEEIFLKKLLKSPFFAIFHRGYFGKKNAILAIFEIWLRHELIEKVAKI